MKTSLTRLTLLATLAFTAVASPLRAELTDSDKKLLVENRLLLMLNGSTANYIGSKMGTDTESYGTTLERNHILMLTNQLRFRAIAEKLGVPTVPTESAKAPTLVEQNNAILKENKVIVTGILGKLGIEPAAAAELTGTVVEQNNAILKANRTTLEKIAAKVDAMK